MSQSDTTVKWDNTGVLQQPVSTFSTDGNHTISFVHDNSQATLIPVAGFEIHVFKYPNWFWRKMTWLAFGWRWKKK